MPVKAYRLLVGGLIGLILILGLAVLLTSGRKLSDRSSSLQTELNQPASDSDMGGEDTSGLAVISSASLPGGESGSGTQGTPLEGAGVTSDTEQPPLVEGGRFEQTGSGPGSTPPVSLPAGVYRVFFGSDGSFGAVRPVVDEGSCGDYPFFLNQPGPFEGSAIYRSLECRVRFEVTDTSGSWTISVAPVDEDSVLAVPVTLTGTDPATTELIDLPEGEYRLALKTDSPYSMVTPIVVDGGCIERPVFVLSAPGDYETAYASRGCQVVFVVSHVTADWEFSISPGG